MGLVACGGGGGGSETGGTTPGGGQNSGPAQTVPLTVRVQGLALGGQLVLVRGGTRVNATLNGDHSLGLAEVGSPLGLAVDGAATGQACALSAAAPARVPATASTVFVRCTTGPEASITRPDTLPNDALTVRQGLRDIAYPGLPYESRPGIVGGIFPYEFRLQSLTLDGVAQDTAGVSLDFRRGTLRFTPATEGRYVLTLTVRDSGRTPKTLTQSFTVQAAAQRFLFVAPDGQDAPGRGSREAPFLTVAYALSQSTPEQALVLRQGRHSVGALRLTDNRAKQLLAYPDEVVTLDLGKTGSVSVNSDKAPAARIEGFDIQGVRQWGIVSDPSRAGLVVRHNRFLDGEASNNSENPAFILGWGDSASTPRHKLLIQDNDFGRFVGNGYAATLFDAGESLLENNQLNLGQVNGGFHDKDNSQHNTYRENYIAFEDQHRTSMGIQISAQAGSANVHIHHNLLINAGVYLGIQCVQASCAMRDHDVHHNTLVKGSIGVNWGPFNPMSGGTRLSYNLISSDTRAPYGGLSCQSRPAGLATQMSVASNLIESSHALAFKDSECTGNDLGWTLWQGELGFDTVASGSTRSSGSALVGSGPLTGLPASDPRRGTRGHQKP